VQNVLLSGGCTIADCIKELSAGAKNHGDFVSGIAHLKNTLRKQGISADGLQGCAGQAKQGVVSVI